jgi:small subunit ribosomal protein S2
MAEKLLMSEAEYKTSGMYIGMKQRTAQMKEFIYRIRPDGLSLLEISKIDERIRIAAKMIARSKKPLIVSRKNIAHEPIKKFSEIVNSSFLVGRFMPGTLTNPSYKKFIEADLILLTDPQIDYQALKEAVDARIPVISVCDSYNDTKDIDLVIPCNNKSARPIVTLFWLLARETLKAKGEISSNEEFKYKIEDFANGMSLDESRKGDHDEDNKIV